MLKKTLTGAAIAALAFPAAHAGAQGFGDRDYDRDCAPMIREARDRLDRVRDDDVRDRIRNTIRRAEDERMDRDYRSCANLAELALNDIERQREHELDRRDRRDDNPFVPDIFKGRR
jgi:hypothetical protein